MTPWTACSTPGFPVHHQLPELAQTHVHWVSDTIQPSHSLSPPSLLPSIFPSIRVFSNNSYFALLSRCLWSVIIFKAVCDRDSAYFSSFLGHHLSSSIHCPFISLFTFHGVTLLTSYSFYLQNASLSPCCYSSSGFNQNIISWGWPFLPPTLSLRFPYPIICFCFTLYFSFKALTKAIIMWLFFYICLLLYNARFSSTESLSLLFILHLQPLLMPNI